MKVERNIVVLLYENYQKEKKIYSESLGAQGKLYIIFPCVIFVESLT